MSLSHNECCDTQRLPQQTIPIDIASNLFRQAAAWRIAVLERRSCPWEDPATVRLMPDVHAAVAGLSRPRAHMLFSRCGC